MTIDIIFIHIMTAIEAIAYLAVLLFAAKSGPQVMARGGVLLLAGAALGIVGVVVSLGLNFDLVPLANLRTVLAAGSFVSTASKVVLAFGIVRLLLNFKALAAR